MLSNARHANPRLPRHFVWPALALIALPGVIVAVVLLSAGATTTRIGTGPAMVSTSAGSAACATSNRAAVDSTHAGARDELVPPGATGVLLCRYGPRGVRVLERPITSRATATRLARELNALPSAKGAYACPLDDGESITADFSYGSAAENPVSVGLSGCQVVTNGHVHRLGLEHPVIARLSELIPWLGTIRGRLVICGGPAPGRCRSTTGFGVCIGSRCLSADQVAITHQVGRQYPNVKLRRGRFTARVEPGRYRLALIGDGPLAQGRVLGTVRVRVRLNDTTRTVFRLSVP